MKGRTEGTRERKKEEMKLLTQSTVTFPKFGCH